MRTWILSALVSLAAAPVLQADVLTPDMTLRITFTVDNNFTPVAPNTMKLNFGLTTVISPYTVRTGKLFDGGTLLGQHDATSFGGYSGPLNLDPSNSWTEPGSPWTFDGAATADFTTILDGSIQGVIEYTIQTGAHDIPANQINLNFIRATSSSGGTVVSPSPTITSIQFLGNDVGTAYCFGDGSGTGCPCGNTGALGEGCANSTGLGAVVTASGSDSVAMDDLAFDAENLLPGQSALLFSALNAVNGGNGNLFGDGLRCAGGGLVRLGIDVPDSSGNASWGPGLGASGGWSSGDVRRFQVWYRDPVGSPCGTDFNLSHGIEILFTL